MAPPGLSLQAFATIKARFGCSGGGRNEEHSILLDLLSGIRASSDLRCAPHFHCLFLQGVCAPDGNGKGQMFHPAPEPTQQDIEEVVERASKRSLRTNALPPCASSSTPRPTNHL